MYVKGGRDVVKEYDIVTYKPSNKEFGFENHHGVMDVWAKNNVPGYKSYDKASTAVALTPGNHNSTRSEFIKWRIEQTGSPAGKIDWTQLSPREVQKLTERMFDSANVPQSARQEYYRAFNKYIYGWD